MVASEMLSGRVDSKRYNEYKMAQGSDQFLRGLQGVVSKKKYKVAVG